MGAWGCNAFENDTVADWLAELPASDLPADVEDALQAALPSPLALMQRLSGKQTIEYLDADVACIALAAAELVAASRRHGHPGMPDSALALLRNPAASLGEDHAELARLAVKRIQENSELRDLWEESDSFDEWLAEMQSLLQRLDERPA